MNIKYKYVCDCGQALDAKWATNIDADGNELEIEIVIAEHECNTRQLDINNESVPRTKE